MVGLSRCVFVEWGEVHDSPGCPVVLWGDDHAAAPLHGLVDRHPLQHPELLVPVQASFDLVTPVERNLTGGVYSHGPGRLVSKEAEGRAVIHELERLVLTAIKGGGRVSVQQVLLNLREVLRCCRAWQGWRGGGR